MTQQIKVELPFGSNSFSFQLCQRKIELEGYGEIDYYWLFAVLCG